MSSDDKECASALLDLGSLRKQYECLQPLYARLAQNIVSAMQAFLQEGSINVLGVSHRIKSFDSFLDKTRRKQASDPLKTIEDICGVRIIAFSPTDLDRIDTIISKEFMVHEAVNKSDIMEPDRFGYRSYHYIVQLRNDWLSAPNYRGLGDLKAEIQVRTILMHAWADLSHSLSYKTKEHVPTQFLRQMYRLSALIELADHLFEDLRNQKNSLREELQAFKVDGGKGFDLSQPMNVDTLQAFLNFYFGDHESSDEDTSDLLKELKDYNITFSSIVNSYEKCRHLLPALEERIFADHPDNEKGRWNQGGVVRAILDLTNDSYWIPRVKRAGEFLKPEAEFREKIKRPTSQ